MSFFFLPKCSGSPRYWPTPPLDIPKVALTLSQTSAGGFLENMIDDFVALITCPDTDSYFHSTSRRAATLVRLVLTKNMVSQQRVNGLSSVFPLLLEFQRENLGVVQLSRVPRGLHCII